MNVFTANYNPGSVLYYKPTGGGTGAIRQRKQAVAPALRIYDIPKETGKVIETFGVIDRNGKPIMSGFKLSDGRKDKRHGAIETGTLSNYSKDLFESMFAGWN